MKKRGSQLWRTLWVVWRRSLDAPMPPCSAIDRNRFRTRHDVIHGPSQSSGYSHHRPTITAAATSGTRTEEHTSELQSLMRISYAVICLQKKNTQPSTTE